MAQQTIGVCFATAVEMQMFDDEGFAFQLQQKEYQQAQARTGISAAPMPVVQGMPVQAVPAGGYRQQPVAGVIGTPVAGVTMLHGVTGTPFTVDAPRLRGMVLSPYHIVVVPDIPDDEKTVLSYRLSLLCFLSIDGVMTLLNALYFLRAMSIANDETAETTSESTSWAGFEVNTGLLNQLLTVCGILHIIAPVCGFIGARKLKRSLVTVYLFFCIFKTVCEVVLALVTQICYLFLVAFVGTWVTKIAFSFWSAMGRITPEKIELLQRQDYIDTVRVQVLYW